MANYAGTWELGAGFQVIFGSTTFNDPLRVSLPKTSVFRKDLVSLGGVTGLVGKKRNSLGELAVVVAGNPAAQVATLVAEPPTSGALTVVFPDGSSKSATAYLVEQQGEDVEPEKEITTRITWKLMAVLA